MSNLHTMINRFDELPVSRGVLILGLLAFVPLLAYSRLKYFDGTTAIPFLSFSSQKQKHVLSKVSPRKDIGEQRISVATRKEQSPSEPTISKESNFPSDWWTSDELYQIERRAIFSQSWLYVTHRRSFTKPGDYHTFELAGFPLFLILGKDGVLRGFHNVCRHRAYPVVRKETGSSIVLGCRYHGWSYNTRGQLVKAPQFDQVEGFDKSRNGLYELHMYVSSKGLVFVNLDAAEPSSGLALDHAEKVVASWDLNNLSDKSCSWELEGKFNWKTALVNTSDVHESLLDQSTGMDEYDEQASSRSNGFWARIVRSLNTLGSLRNTKGKVIEVLLETYPVTKIGKCTSGSEWYTLSLFPKSSTRTAVCCNIYQSGNDRPRDDLRKQLKHQVAEMIHKLETLQAQLVTIESGQTDISKQNSQDPWGSQSRVLSLLKTHLKLEKTAGREILPAFAGHITMSDEGKEADQLCKELDSRCGVVQGDVMDGATIASDDALSW